MKAVLSYLLALAGSGLMLYAIADTFGRMRYMQARFNLLQMLATDPHRAELMCKAKSNTFTDAIANAFKIVSMTGSQEPAIVQSATVPGYDAAVAGITQYWKQKFGLVKKAGMLSIGAVGLAIGLKVMPAVHIILALASIAGGIYFFLYKVDVERGLLRARAEVLPQVDRAIIEGRYRLPPAPGVEVAQRIVPLK